MDEQGEGTVRVQWDADGDGTVRLLQADPVVRFSRDIVAEARRGHARSLTFEDDHLLFGTVPPARYALVDDGDPYTLRGELVET